MWEIYGTYLDLENFLSISFWYVIRAIKLTSDLNQLHIVINLLLITFIKEKFVPSHPILIWYFFLNITHLFPIRTPSWFRCVLLLCDGDVYGLWRNNYEHLRCCNVVSYKLMYSKQWYDDGDVECIQMFRTCVLLRNMILFDALGYIFWCSLIY